MKIMDIIDDKYTKKGTWIKDGVLMCNKECCGSPVSECSCDSSCKKCNCYNLKENKVVEAIPKSTMYGLVIDGEYVAKGSKADMRKLQKQKGGTVYNAPGKKVGDKAGVVKDTGSPWTSSGKHPENMNREELQHEIDIFKQYQKAGMSLSPQEIMRMDSLYDYLDIVDENVVKERYGMRQGVAQNREYQDDVKNANKRMQNKAQDQNREINIKNSQAMRRNVRLGKKIATGLPTRLINPQQAQAPEGQS